MALYAVTLFLGMLVLEGFIEEGGNISDAFTWFGISHEIPQLFYNTAAVGALKLVIDYGYTLRQQRIVQLEKDKAQSEAMFLKSQLNPHVLFNNLNNIYSFALHQPEKTPEMILKLAEVMRYMLYDSQHDFVPLNQELQYLDNYIELQITQLEGRGEIKFEKKGDFAHNEIAPMMLISVIENCFKHAARTKADDLRILIKIQVEDNQLELFTENTFEEKLADSEDDLTTGGIGLSNVQRRLQLIYPDRHQLLVKTIEDIYIVSLSIALK